MKLRPPVRFALHPCLSLFAAGLLATALLAAGAPGTAADETANEHSAVQQRLAADASHLASDELEGRGIGTKGLELAADYLAEQFAAIGLKTDCVDGAPFQPFKITTHTEQGPQEQNRLSLIGAGQNSDKQTLIELTLGRDFAPLAIGGSGVFDAPLVFVGYGITAPEREYDDYAGLDVQGKVVVVLRHHPRNNDPHGPFASPRGPSRHALFQTKVSNAYQHGAAAVILVNDAAEIDAQIKHHRERWQASIDELAKVVAEFRERENPTHEQLEAHRQEVEKLADRIRTQGRELQQQYDPVLPFSRAGTDNGGREMPVFFCTRAALAPVLRAALDMDLAALERAIDEGPRPRSAELSGWRAVGQASVIRKQADVKNVVGVLEGHGPHAEETIVIGAHYDHLGRGGPGSLARGSEEIHNGADDNASGCAVLLEVARRLVARPDPPPRRIVFIGFSAEERGLLGSAHYTAKPVFPLDSTVAMLNLDMVGRLDQNKLIIQGVDTAEEFAALVDRLNEQQGFEITRQPGGFGPSDHASFYAKQIPVMHFYTGSHKDYHRPSDTAEKLNLDGMRRIGDMVADAALALAEAAERPKYREAQAGPMARSGGDRPYFGSIPDFSQLGGGYAISGVTQDGPAARAGIKEGDVLIKLGDNKISNLEDFDAALRKYKADDVVPVVVRRGEQELTLQVKLEPPR